MFDDGQVKHHIPCDKNGLLRTGIHGCLVDGQGVEREMGIRGRVGTGGDGE